MVLSWFVAWHQAWSKAWCQLLLRVLCAARKVVKGAIKGAAVSVGCATVLCCRGYEDGDSPTALTAGLGIAGLTVDNLIPDERGFSGAPIGTDMVAFTAGMAIAASMITAGSTLDNAVVTAINDPKSTQKKKKALRRLNVGYSLAKLGLVAGIAKGFSWYVDQCERKSDKALGVLGGLSAASLVLMSIAKTVWV